MKKFMNIILLKLVRTQTR